MAVNTKVEEVNKIDKNDGQGYSPIRLVENSRLQAVKTEEKAALKENNELYNKMASNAGEYYDDMADAVKANEKVQTENQKAATDFAIEKVEQQKAQTKGDYTKEQAGSWADYQKQINPYGVQAEQVAESGLDNSGYAESLKTKAYVAYQNRVAVARESYQRAVLNYDNAITEARLQNNAALAEIAFNSLMKQLELTLTGFQYKNTLIIDKADQNLAITQTYNQQYQDVLQAINQENALAENKRQFNAQMALEQEKFAFQKQQASSTGSASTGSRGSSGSSSSKKKKTTKKASTTYINGKKSTSNSGVKAVNKDDKVTVDMKSVLNLGYGPISATKLNSLIEKGTVQEYKENGKLKYRKVFKR